MHVVEVDQTLWKCSRTQAKSRCESAEMGGSKEEKEKTGPTSNLPFDVDPAEGGRPGSLKEGASLASH